MLYCYKFLVSFILGGQKNQFDETFDFNLSEYYYLKPFELLINHLFSKNNFKRGHIKYNMIFNFTTYRFYIEFIGMVNGRPKSKIVQLSFSLLPVALNI